MLQLSKICLPASPGKKSRLEEEEETSGDSGDKKEMDLQKSELQENEDHEMDVEEDSSCSPYRPKLAPGKCFM